ncbi:MAG: hypothetical protein Q4C61_12100 [Lachnospiraceae bacterium]|nr:hypothetical protein [Lachnospiraceae bacterium]
MRIGLYKKIIFLFVFCLICSSKVYAQMEGDGYNSSKAALEAYICAMKAGDIDEMLSVFAIETYAAHYNLEQTIEKTGTYTAQNLLPPTNELAKQLNIELRRKEVMEEIRKAYLFWPIEVGGYSNPYEIPIPVNSTAAAFFDELFPLDVKSLYASIQFNGEFYMLNELLEEQWDSYYSEENTIIRERTRECLGADEYTSEAAALKIDFPFLSQTLEENWTVLFMADTVRYGDRWYILDLQGEIGKWLGYSQLTGGWGK